MAMLAGRGAPAHGATRGYRGQSVTDEYAASYGGSPTESDFSDVYAQQDDVLTWDERQVGDWLQSIGAEKYIANFQDHHITGEVLVDIDQQALRDIGVKKIGDRVRINAQVKLFRHREYRSKRKSNRDSFAALDHSWHPVSTHSAASIPKNVRSVPSSDRMKENSYLFSATGGSTDSRPSSPYKQESIKLSKYMSGSSSQISLKSTETPQTARFNPTPQSARFPMSKYSSNDGHSSTSPLPSDKSIRVIYDNGRAMTISVDGLQTGEEVVLRALKKGGLNESHVKSYCFWFLEGTDAVSANCRKLYDFEIIKLCFDRARPERERMMLRKIHAGEPEGAQLQTAANAAVQTPRIQISHGMDKTTKSHMKIQQLMGESLPQLTYPMSPASAAMRRHYLETTALELERPVEPIQAPPPRRRPPKMKEFHGARPPSELVVADPLTYFPDADREEIERVRRMSMRRSQRLSRANSRLSTVSNFSVASSIARGLEDAPPLPAISDHWLKEGHGVRARPLSVLRGTRPISSYRDSVASSMLEPLEEERSFEPDRKSYVSMNADSAPGSAAVSIMDPEGNASTNSYFDDGSPAQTEAGSSYNEQLTQALLQDGEEPDEELNEYLKNDTWDNIKYIRGKLIGQGSFGSVYLALHSFTAELMAVKQVELPSTEGTAIDAKKNNMVEALKREIALLRELKHRNIVQYLGSSSDDNHLNIFLEYIPGGSIAKMLVDFGPFNEDLCSKFVQQILVGLAYLHSKDIIHRDIKGANILVDNHGTVKISDFGISKRVQDSKTLLETGGAAGGAGEDAANTTGTGRRRPGAGAFAQNRVSLQGSVFWMAPEVVKQTAYTRKADIWSLGCLVVEMLTGKHPHPNCTQLQAIFKIGGNPTGHDPSPEIPEAATPAAKDLLQATFRYEHLKRPEADELLKMDFVRRYDAP